MILRDQRFCINMNDSSVQSPTTGLRYRFPEKYWRQLRYIGSDIMTVTSFSHGAHTSLWNIPEELKWAQSVSNDELTLALAFITACEFRHSASSFVPFRTISTVPTYSTVKAKYLDFQNSLPKRLKLTSELALSQGGTMFETVPYKVVQHAMLDTTTFELTMTHAMVWWKEESKPVCHKGTFVPKDHCQWRKYPL